MSHLESMIAGHFLTGRLPQTEGEVSAKFLKGARKAIDIYLQWKWSFNRNVDLSCFTPVAHPVNKNGKVATFFTLGVDSFHTLLQNVDEIDDIIYIKGFERRLGKEVLEEIREKIQYVARIFNKRPVFWLSNIRDCLDNHVNWELGHGPALAAEGLLRDNVYKKIYIPASTVDPSIPCGSHQDIDPLWSTEALEFIHYGAISRLEKLQYIAEKSQLALDLLRVCYQGKSYNCSKCAKCVRTIISLNLLGLHSAAFDRRPSLQTVNRLAKEVIMKGELRLPNRKPQHPLWGQNIREAERFLKALKGQL